MADRREKGTAGAVGAVLAGQAALIPAQESPAAYTAFWILWVGSFLLVEGAALARQYPGDTFTENFRRWLQLQAVMRAPTALGTVGLWATRGVVAVFGVWLTAHMALGMWGGGGL